MNLVDEEAGEELALNLTPLVDIAFLLLIFFMVTTTFQDPERSLDVDLPEAQSGSPEARAPEELVINVLQDGETVVGGETLDAEALTRGVTPAMVHYYFGSKEGLHDAMLERTFDRVLERVAAVAARVRSEEGGPDERLGDLLEVLVQTFAAEPWVPTLVVREVFSEGGRFRDRFVQSYASRMAALLATGGFGGDNSSTVGVGLDDWEWGVSLHSDDALVFKKLIYEMRFDPASALYAEFGPFYVGVHRTPADLEQLLSCDGNPA